MNYLLDTTVFMWSLKEPEKLNKSAHDVLEDSAQHAFLSAVSSWEIVIKAAIGKIKLPEQPAQFIADALARFSLNALSITHAHSLAVGELAFHHRDPFDRMLVAQARSEHMVLMTADAIMEKYPVEILWCRK